jgi:hypothetical protein
VRNGWFNSLILEVLYPCVEKLLCFVCRVKNHLEVTISAGKQRILPASV